MAAKETVCRTREALDNAMPGKWHACIWLLAVVLEESKVALDGSECAISIWADAQFV